MLCSRRKCPPGIYSVLQAYVWVACERRPGVFLAVACFRRVKQEPKNRVLSRANVWGTLIVFMHWLSTDS